MTRKHLIGSCIYWCGLFHLASCMCGEDHIAYLPISMLSEQAGTITASDTVTFNLHHRTEADFFICAFSQSQNPWLVRNLEILEIFINSGQKLNSEKCISQDSSAYYTGHGMRTTSWGSGVKMIWNREPRAQVSFNCFCEVLLRVTCKSLSQGFCCCDETP